MTDQTHAERIAAIQARIDARDYPKRNEHAAQDDREFLMAEVERLETALDDEIGLVERYTKKLIDANSKIAQLEGRNRQLDSLVDKRNQRLEALEDEVLDLEG